MQAPTGCSGVQTFPKIGHSFGLIFPMSTSPHRQAGLGLPCISGIPNRILASNSPYSGRRRRSPEPGIFPIPRQTASQGSMTSSISALPIGVPSSATTLGYAFSANAVPFSRRRMIIAIAVRISEAVKPQTTPEIPSF